MKRLIFINRFFYPDHSATSQMLSDLAFYLASSGGDVHVITSRQRYDQPDALLPAAETIRGVHIIRVATTRFGRMALAGRAVDYLSFYASTWHRLLTLANSDDVIIAKTDPPLVSIPAQFAAKRRHARIVNWLHDLYPEIAIELGVSVSKGPLAFALTYLRDRSLRKADLNVVLGKRMAERLCTRGIPTDRIRVIHNWCDDEKVTPILAAENPLRREWNVQDKFVVGYSGNLGRAHEFETVLGAAERLGDNPRVMFVCIGGGYHFEELARRVSERGFQKLFRFFPYQERTRLRYSLSLPDVHWISLRPQLEGLIVPSKFYGIAAAGRPIIAITARDGEIAEIVRKHRCGVVVEPGNPEALVDVIMNLSTNSDECAAMGARARAMLDAQFSRCRAFDLWRSSIENVA
jgi:glycosyltransferase involved in cell wall biosynthesis